VTSKSLDLSEEELREVRDRSLVAAYQPHDVAQDFLEDRLDFHGFIVEQHGTDDRYSDDVYLGHGPDIAVYRLREDVRRNYEGIGSTYIESDTGRFCSRTDAYELVAYIEIKSKELPSWFGRCNRRHFTEYVNFSNEVSVPVFIWFALVDSESETVHRDALFEVEGVEQIDGSVTELSQQELAFYEDNVREINDNGLCALSGTDVVDVANGDAVVEYIPDVWGNEVVCLNEDKFRSFSYFVHRVNQ